MKILLLTFGTRGDVQPYIALGRRLVDRGHAVVLAAPQRFGALVREAGLEFGALDDGPLAQMDVGSEVGEVAEGGLRAKVALARRLPGMFAQTLRDAQELALGMRPDLVVHNGQVLAGPHLAEKLGVPAVLGLPLPMYVPTREFAWPGMDLPRLPAWGNRVSFTGMQGTVLAFGKVIDDWRAELGLPRRPRRHDPLLESDGTPALTLHAVSPHVIPRPADWPETARMTGYWFTSDPDATLPAELEDFLAAGEPPVYVGFGSMSGKDPARTSATVFEAIERAGVRAVVASGWGGIRLEADADRVFTVDDVPHGLLFPRVSAVVHHGGAGTTAAAVRAGRPQVVCPFVADQPFWAKRMQSLGVAPPPLPQKHLAAEPLADRLETVLTEARMSAAASELGSAVQAEDGTGDAVGELELQLSRVG